MDTDNPNTPEVAVAENVETTPELPSAEDTEFRAGVEADLASSDQASEPAGNSLSGESAQDSQETLLAGKFTNVGELEKAYGGLQRMLGEDGRYKPEVDRLQRELDEVRGKMAELSGVAEASAPAGGQQPQWIDEWQKSPLSNAPDPVLEKEAYQNWVENVFTPHLINRPAETISHLVRPEVERIRDEVRQEFAVREQQAQIDQAINHFWSSPAEWSGDKTVRDALNSLPNPEQVGAEFDSMLSQGYPPEAAAELLYRRHTTGEVQEKNEVLSARDRELRELASGSSNRGPTPGTTGTAPSDPMNFMDNMQQSLAAEGIELGDEFSPIRKLQ